MRFGAALLTVNHLSGLLYDPRKVVTSIYAGMGFLHVRIKMRRASLLTGNHLSGLLYNPRKAVTFISVG